MPWGDRAVSPCVFTPGVADADKLSLGIGLQIIDGRLGPPAGFLYYRLNITQLGTAGGTTGAFVTQLEFYDADGRWSPINMTSDSHNGFVASAKAVYGSSATYAAYKAFDGTADGQWGTENQTTVPIWLQLQAPDYKELTKYAITRSGWWDYTPRAWQILASNTGSFTGEEAVLHTGAFSGWQTTVRQEFAL